MAEFDQELMSAALLLLKRKTGQKGPLPSARIRRSISTVYYALFHFVLGEVGKRVIGSTNDLRTRRRILARTITHSGAKLAFDKVRGRTADQTIQDFIRSGGGTGAVNIPAFVSEFAKAFVDAHAKRQDADYNLNATLSARDARLLGRRVRNAIRGWRAAKSGPDRDIQKAVCILVLMKGVFRSPE